MMATHLICCLRMGATGVFSVLTGLLLSSLSCSHPSGMIGGSCESHMITLPPRDRATTSANRASRRSLKQCRQWLPRSLQLQL